MADLIEDLSTLTTIPQVSLKKLVEKTNYCICYDIQEATKCGNNITEVDIGIGTLYILVENEAIKYKFIPSKDLEKNVIKTVNSGTNPLTDKIEATLKEKITNVYKELF